jgi:sporulation protein YunB
LHRRIWYPPRRSGEHGLLFSALVGVGLALAVICWISGQLRPVLSAMATAKVTNVINQTISQSVSEYIEEHNLTYQDFITLEKDSSGRITAMTSNMAALNRLRTDLLDQVVNTVDCMDTGPLTIPFGNLTGLSILSGRGLGIPVDIVTAGSTTADFENAFSEAGINQTHHQIMLNFSVNVEILLPGENLPLDITVPVCVAETIIVGSVPDTYLQLKNS